MKTRSIEKCKKRKREYLLSAFSLSQFKEAANMTENITDFAFQFKVCINTVKNYLKRFPHPSSPNRVFGFDVLKSTSEKDLIEWVGEKKYDSPMTLLEGNLAKKERQIKISNMDKLFQTHVDCLAGNAHLLKIELTESFSDKKNRTAPLFRFPFDDSAGNTHLPVMKLSNPVLSKESPFLRNSAIPMWGAFRPTKKMKIEPPQIETDRHLPGIKKSF